MAINRAETTSEIVNYVGFDSLTHYQFAHFANIDRDYSLILEDVAQEWDRIDSSFDIPYYPHTSIGWDNKPRFKEFRPGIVKNNTPANVEQGFRMAKDYLDNHPNQKPLLTINSWRMDGNQLSSA